MMSRNDRILTLSCENRVPMTGTGNTGRMAGESGLFTAWERHTRRWALVFAVLTLVVSALVTFVFMRAGRDGAAALVFTLIPALVVYAWRTQRI